MAGHQATPSSNCIRHHLWVYMCLFVALVTKRLERAMCGASVGRAWVAITLALSRGSHVAPGSPGRLERQECRDNHVDV